MAEDLRRSVAVSEHGRQNGMRDTWAPGSWAAAAIYNSSPKPEPRYPIIIGGDGAVRTAEHLRDLCRLPSVPPTSPTTKASLSAICDERRPDQDRPVQTFEIADVSFKQYLELPRHTEGKMVCLWSQGLRRLAWFAASIKAEDLNSHGSCGSHWNHASDASFCHHRVGNKNSQALAHSTPHSLPLTEGAFVYACLHDAHTENGSSTQTSLCSY